MLSARLSLHLGVVEEIALDPGARRRLACPRAQLVDDAGDGDELDLVRVADQHLVEQDRARARDCGQSMKPGTTVICLASIGLGALAGERLDVLAVAHRDESAGFDREGLRRGAERPPYRPWR